MKTVLMLARLAMPPGQRIDRKRLIDLLWPDRGEAQALASLRQALWSLRKGLGAASSAVIVTDRSDILLDAGCVEVDTVEFERHAREASRDALEAAAELYRGDYLAELDLADAPEHAPFLYERQRLRDLALSVLKRLVGLRAGAGDLDGAADVAQRALAIDPLQEDLHAALMRLHAQRGRLGLARAQYETCRETLRRELDVGPSEELEALRQSLGRSSGLAGPGRIGMPELDVDGGRPVAAHPARTMTPWALLALALATASALLASYVYTRPGRAPPAASELAASDGRPSLVVLPFEDLRAGVRERPFGEELTQGLVSDLSKVPNLRVRSGEGGLPGAATAEEAHSRAADLGMDYALMGSVRRSGETTRISAQLVDAATGASVWAHDYDQQGSDPFRVEDEVVQGIVESLDIELGDRERRTITRIPTDNLEAYDYYLRAEHQATEEGEAENYRRSLAGYHRAIELDPGFAGAYAGLARLAVTIWRGDLNEILPSAVAKREAYEAAGTALALDPENARAYSALSLIEAVDGERQAAVTSGRKAVALEPGDAEAHANLALVLDYTGDVAGATAEVATARRLNPELPTDLRLVSGLVAFAGQRYDEAIRELSAVRDSVPRSELVLEYLAAAYAYLGDTARAQATVAELRQVLPITNLSFYEVMRANVGTPEQTARFVEGLRLAGVPPWPFDDRRRPEDRVAPDELGRLTTAAVWTGRLENGAAFVQYFDQGGGFAYRSINSLLSGRSEIRDGKLCQQIAGYLMDRETCGFVYRDASAAPAGESYVYVSSDAVKHFSVSR